MAEQAQATVEITRAVEDTRRQSEQLSRALAEQTRGIRDMTGASQNISKQIVLITRANREHSKVANSILESLHQMRKVTAQNSEGAKNTLSGTQTLLDTVEALVADVNGLRRNGTSNGNGRKGSSRRRRPVKNA
jgi:methyl-accepting chemotaxis protein